MLKFLDFFAGIGLFRLGLEKAGHICIGHCEIDKYANATYKALHNPTKEEYFANDITKINSENLPKADIWTGGFPCQDASVAKGASRTGLSGKRSGLFYDFINLLQSQKEENKPTWLIIENVRGLFSVNGTKDFGRVLYKLAESGYSVQYALLNSKDFGVPQNRERVYLIGYKGELDKPFFPLPTVKPKPLSSILEIDVDEKYFVSKEKTEAILNNLYEDLLKRGKIEKPTGKLIELLKGSQGSRVYSTDGLSVCLSSAGGGQGAKTGLYMCSIQSGVTKARDYSTCITSSIAHSFSPNDDNRRSFAVYTDLPRAVLTPDRVKKRQNGRRIKEGNEPVFTLTSQDIHGILQNSRIRRLTPRECFRLQGVTDKEFNRIKQNALCHRGKSISDSQLYKQAGNAVTVQVVKAIGDRIREIEKEVKTI